MSNGGQNRDTGILRLASARRRVLAFLNEIETLEGSEFPHEDGEFALRDIRQHFRGLLAGTYDIEEAPVKTVREACSNINLSIRRYTPVLGFILRSTNVRNAFEIHFALKNLVEKLIGKGAKLIISSEWDFVPFTYPMNLDILPSYVLVGGPAPESGSALLTPLAGHEIGHSAWARFNIDGRFKQDFLVAIGEELALSSLSHASLEDHIGPDPLLLLRDVGLKQIEEIFCDAFGLFIFGSSYAYAYEYIMYPGGFDRVVSYPSEINRGKYLLQAARWHGTASSPNGPRLRASEVSRASWPPF